MKNTLSMAFVFLLALSGCEKKEEKVLNLAIWGNYISPELQNRFTKKTGIKIRTTLYSSNEELLAKVQTGSSNFDVAVPSDYMVGVMIKLNLLEPLDKNQLQNLPNLDPQFLKQNFDPENNFSIPYAWTTTGIAFQKNSVSQAPKSWKDLFENPELKGKISALDDMRELSAAALKVQNKSVNSDNPAEVSNAFSFLKKNKGQVKIFTANAVDLLKTREILAGQVYSSDALLAQKENSEIEFVLPVEGSTRAIDNLVIVRKAPNREAAHAFLNFLMTEEAGVSLVENLRAGPVVKGVKAKLPKELQNNKALFPEKSSLTKLESIVDLGEKNSLYENSWTDFKSN